MQVGGKERRTQGRKDQWTQDWKKGGLMKANNVVKPKRQKWEITRKKAGEEFKTERK